MQIYKFFDSDISGKEELDISGEEYRTLLNTCFKYSATVSVLIPSNYIERIQSWEQYRVPITPSVQKAYGHYGSPSASEPDQIGSFKIRHYELTENLKQLILYHTDSIFKWICAWGYNNPNDITFFRNDGSVFFSSIVHEGECTLFIRNSENVDCVISQSHWFLT